MPASRKSPVPAAKWFFALYLIAGTCWLAGSAAAEEGGSGHYLPGSMSSFADGVPLKEAFIVRANVVNYNGNINATNHGFDEFFGNLYHLNAEEEPENPDYPKNPDFKKKFGPRGDQPMRAARSRTPAR